MYFCSRALLLRLRPGTCSETVMSPRGRASCGMKTSNHDLTADLSAPIVTSSSGGEACRNEAGWVSSSFPPPPVPLLRPVASAIEFPTLDQVAFLRVRACGTDQVLWLFGWTGQGAHGQPDSDPRLHTVGERERAAWEAKTEASLSHMLDLSSQRKTDFEKYSQQGTTTSVPLHARADRSAWELNCKSWYDRTSWWHRRQCHMLVSFRTRITSCDPNRPCTSCPSPAACPPLRPTWSRCAAPSGKGSCW